MNTDNHPTDECPCAACVQSRVQDAALAASIAKALDQRGPTDPADIPIEVSDALDNKTWALRMEVEGFKRFAAKQHEIILNLQKDRNKMQERLDNQAGTIEVMIARNNAASAENAFQLARINDLHRALDDCLKANNVAANTLDEVRAAYATSLRYVKDLEADLKVVDQEYADFCAIIKHQNEREEARVNELSNVTNMLYQADQMIAQQDREIARLNKLICVYSEYLTHSHAREDALTVERDTARDRVDALNETIVDMSEELI
jgi:chromosome segregation ATPase